MKRGDIALVAFQGDFGKVRPALVVQRNLFIDESTSITFCLITSDVRESSFLRIDIVPTEQNGLMKPSQVQADKIVTVQRNRIRKQIGFLTDVQLASVERALALHLDMFAPQR